MKVCLLLDWFKILSGVVQRQNYKKIRVTISSLKIWSMLFNGNFIYCINYIMYIVHCFCFDRCIARRLTIHKLRRSYVIMKLCIGDPARWLKLDSGRRLNGITCRRSASAQHCPFGIFYTRRPLGSEQRCLSLHRIWCPLHLLNNSMERGDISSRIITVWGWQAPLSRARWEQALHCWRELKDTATAGAAGTADDKSFS